jgi:cytoskeletal protein CcmA (bactofilin family)
MNRRIFGAALAILIAPIASAAPLSAFSVFAGGDMSLGNDIRINSGMAGSNGDMSVNAGSITQGLMGGGHLGAGSMTTGNVTFNGYVDLSANTKIGNINSGGFVDTGMNTVVTGNIRAGEKVTVSANAKVTGNVDAGKAAGEAISVAANAKVTGAATHAAPTTLSVANGASVGSNVIAAPAAPTAYAPTVLAAKTAFSAGATNISMGAGKTTTLAAGTWGDITLGMNNTFNLSSGTYYFNSLKMGANNFFNFDLRGGDIALYFVNDVSIGQDLKVTLDGGDAGDMYAETTGNWSQGSGGEWFGTVFGSGATSDLSFGMNNVLTGAFYARDDFHLGANGIVNLAALEIDPIVSANVPEPSSILLGAIGLLGLGFGRRRAARQA